MSPRPVLDLQGVGKSYRGKAAVRDAALSVAPGEILAVVGPSGCGKTTLLRLIAGLERPDGGSIRCDGGDLSGVPTHKRRIGFMFQDYALFPHLSVGANVGFALRGPAAVRAERVRELLARVRLDGFTGRSVESLSGGEAQRVALARSLAAAPRVLLLDEPLGALDVLLRRELAVDLGETLRKVGMTSVYVTHDQEEAFSLADRVAVMNGGRILQAGTAGEVIRRPATRFVASFLSLGALVPGAVRREGDAWSISTEMGTYRFREAFEAGTGDGFLLIRPAAVLQDDSADGLRAAVVSARSLPPGDRVLLRLGRDVLLECPWPLCGSSARGLPAAGSVLGVRLDADSLGFVPGDGL